jgi:hypothetical protein
MRRDADTASAELTDVYSLAKTLWSAATGERYPPQGKLRSDRHASRLSSYVDDRRTTLLEPCWSAAHLMSTHCGLPCGRWAEELTWWSAPPTVPVQVDLSGYAMEVRHLRQAYAVTKAETEHERLARLYGEALARVHAGLLVPLMGAVEQSGLRNMGSPPRDIEGQAPDNYGTSGSQPCRRIKTLASPCLVAFIGVIHRAQPAEDLADLGVTALIMMQTADSQHVYLKEVEYFRSGSPHLDQIINQLGAKINAELPGIIAHFLTACRESGIPRR